MLGTIDLSRSQLDTLNRSIAETHERVARVVIHPDGIDENFHQKVRVVFHIDTAEGRRTLQFGIDRDGTRRAA